ncbi:Gfo/Idh/MocA family oxidoreductase [Flaviaesturariibacter amylovorans]|uniref:Gfo/Idh/MocA family oxidoreductase n=1 Tax=Flaviaesturariibacter amylovorans TaxID=1084520 RepID=A0ABP8GSW1_9BACT
MYQFALVGCGRIGARHAEQIQQKGRLVAVCDTDSAKAEAFGNRYGARTYPSIDHLLASEKEIDVVVVCTPNGLHAEHCIKSLQAYRHVLCEKPLCLTSAGAWEMLNTAHFFRRKLHIVKQNRYNEPVRFVKDLLERGALGRILSFQLNCFWQRPESYYNGDWHGDPNLDGGLLYTQFSHFIDLLYWFLGDITWAQGRRSNHGLRANLKTEDSGVALLRTEGGVSGTLHYTINSGTHNREGSLTLFGEMGSVKIGGEYLNLLEWSSGIDTSGYEPGSGTANDYGAYTGSMSNHHLVYDDLLRALDGSPNSLPSILEAVKVVEIIERIYRHSELDTAS